jgi:hypothetical protein
MARTIASTSCARAADPRSSAPAISLSSSAFARSRVTSAPLRAAGRGRARRSSIASATSTNAGRVRRRHGSTASGGSTTAAVRRPRPWRCLARKRAVEPRHAEALSQRQEMIVIRDRHHPRLCRTCQAPMARQEASCWRCGAACDAGRATRAAAPPEPLGSLRARTGHVLDTRAGRRAASARRDRRPSRESAGRAAS